jgi:hypothetical protein
MPEPTRSDCHAWGAHPVYHYLATLAGIRPAGFGFRQVSVHPQMGRLTHIEGVMPHRCGPIEFSWQRRGNTLAGHITLPPGLSGAATLNGATRPLSPGKNIIA